MTPETQTQSRAHPAQLVGALFLCLVFLAPMITAQTQTGSDAWTTTEFDASGTSIRVQDHRNADVNDEGDLLVQWRSTVGGNGFTGWRVYNTDLQLLAERIIPVATCQTSCTEIAIQWSFDGNVFFAYNDGSADLLGYYEPDDGTPANPDLSEIGLSVLSMSNFDDIAAVAWPGDGSHVVVADRVGQRVALFNFTGENEVWNVAVTDVEEIHYDHENDYVWATKDSGSSVVLNRETGAVIEASAGGSLIPYIQLDETTDDSYLYLTETGAANDRAFDWALYDLSDDSAAGDTPTGNQIEGVDTNLFYSMPDGSDRALFCGHYKPTNNLGYVAILDTGDNDVIWNETLTADGDTADGDADRVVFCHLDYNGGFWAIADDDGGQEYTSIYHYDAAGELVTNNAQGMDPINSGSSAGGGNEEVPDGVFGTLVTYFTDAWGVSTSAANWLFALTVIGVVLIAFTRIASNPAVIGVALLFGVVLAWALGFVATWFLLLIVAFGVAAMAIVISAGADNA